ncbi:MAG TPA: GNAT family N-acetyltransferase [Longimicrobiaceae bacterium]
MTVFPDADALLAGVGAELEREEELNSLLLGAALAARASGGAPFCAAVRDGARLELAALMTPPRPLLLAGDAAEGDGALAAVVAELRTAGRPVPAVAAPDPLAEWFARLWTEAAGAPVRGVMRQRLHALTEVEPVPTVPGRMRRAAAGDVERVARWMAAFDAEALGEADPGAAREGARGRIGAGEVYLWDDGEPRAMAARARPTRRTVAVNGVYTPPEQRGRGLATALVAELSRALLGEGFRSCVLFTDLANPTSNAVYARIGYRPVRDFAMLRFGAEAGAG